MLIDDVAKEVALETISEYIGILSQKNNAENSVDIQKAEKIKENLIYENDEKTIYQILNEYNKKLKKLHYKE